MSSYTDVVMSSHLQGPEPLKRFIHIAMISAASAIPVIQPDVPIHSFYRERINADSSCKPVQSGSSLDPQDSALLAVTC